jgi:mannan endo-1,4-beta-mannosidase
MKRTPAALVLIVAGCLAIVVALAQARSSPFVSRSGTRLVLNGSTWRFIAYNDYDLTSLPGGFECGGALDQPTLDSVMQGVKSSGGTVVRTWFFQSYYDLGMNNQPTTPSWTAFDRVLAAAAQYGLKVIPVLTNEYSACEPGAAPKNLSFFTSGYESPQGPYPLSFKTYATTVAAHYAANPTIAFWQLGNELAVNTGPGCSAGTERASAKALRGFADDMTGAIKGADPNHLVSLGTIGTGQCGLQVRDYAYVQAGKIDICDYHDYGDVTQPIPSDGFNRLAQRISECQAMHKPLVVTESGIPANVDDRGVASGAVTAATLQLRAGFFAATLPAAFAAGVSGYGLWEKQQNPSISPYNIAQDQFEIGPGGAGGDPTDAVTAAIAARLGHSLPTDRFDFEAGTTDGWQLSAGSGAVGNSTAEAWSGYHSLAITLDDGSGFASVSTPETGGAGSGTTLTFHVYRPLFAPETVEARPLVVNRGRTVRGPTTALLSGWNTITWKLPAHLHRPLTRIGLSIIDVPRWRGTVYLDDVAWH